MSDTDAAHWNNYWRGRTSQNSGNALIEVGIENNHALKKFWLEFFEKKQTSDKVIDFACGAGSVLEHADKSCFSNLTGVDVSQDAIDAMIKKIPTAVGICSQINSLPPEIGNFDIIVSQFGVEYAGDRDNLLKAVSEMHRVLKPGGEIMIIAHAENSLIYDGCAASLTHSKIIEDSHFISLSQKIISKLHTPQTAKRDAELQIDMVELNQSAEPLMAWLKVSDREKNEFARFTYHVLESSHKLITRHNVFSEKDSLNWFSDIKAELEAYKGRMQSMVTAALSESEIFDLKAALKTRKIGLDFDPIEPFYFPPHENLAAWSIRATKQ